MSESAPRARRGPRALIRFVSRLSFACSATGRRAASHVQGTMRTIGRNFQLYEWHSGLTLDLCSSLDFVMVTAYTTDRRTQTT
eukprot:3601325-Prymnesium_polylepis.3